MLFSGIGGALSPTQLILKPLVTAIAEASAVPKTENENPPDSSGTSGSGQEGDPPASGGTDTTTRPAQPAPPRQSAETPFRAQAVEEEVPVVEQPTARGQEAAAPISDARLDSLRAALAVVTEVAENPVDARIAQLFEKAEVGDGGKETEATDSAEAPEAIDTHPEVEAEQSVFEADAAPAESAPAGEGEAADAVAVEASAERASLQDLLARELPAVAKESYEKTQQILREADAVPPAESAERADGGGAWPEAA